MSIKSLGEVEVVWTMELKATRLMLRYVIFCVSYITTDKLRVKNQKCDCDLRSTLPTDWG